MRFTNEELIEKLKQRLTNDGRKPLRMSERTLKEQSEDLIALLANDDTELDDFIQKVLPSFERINSNVEHDVAESLRRLNEASAQPIEGRNEIEDDTVSQIRKQLDELLAEREKERNERLVHDKTESIKRFLKGKNITDSSWIDNVTGLIQIGVDADVETIGENLLKLYNTQQSTDTGAYTPSQPGRPSVQPEEQFSDIAERLKRDRERGLHNVNNSLK